MSTSWELILPFLVQIEAEIKDPTVSEIMVNGDGSVFVERGGLVAPLAARIPQQQLLAGVKTIARRLGDDVSEAKPILDSRLEDGSRVAAVLPPAALGGIVLTIRRFSAKHFTLDDLIKRDTLDQATADLLAGAIRDRRNVLISGGTSTGKTTLLNVLASFIPAEDRIVVIEDTAEISISAPNLVRFEAKLPRPGVDAVTIRHLLKASLRHRPDRIVVGEVRDGAAYDLLQALNTGHGGSMSTVHADTATGALSRFASLVLESGVQLPFPAIKANIATALNLLVHIDRRPGLRYVSEVLEVRGYEPDRDRYDLAPLYRREKAGRISA